MASSFGRSTASSSVMEVGAARTREPRSRRSRRRDGSVRAAIVVALALVSSVMTAAPSYGATIFFNVNQTADLQDTNPGDGNCSTGSGCSVRAAITEANAVGPGDTAIVNIPGSAGLFDLTLGELVINSTADSVVIGGAGGANTRISGNNSSRVFNVTGNHPVTFVDLRMQDGFVNGEGGCLRNDGPNTTLDTVSIEDCATGNDVGGPTDGGGVANLGGLTVTVSSIRFNTATGGGGGIWSQSGSTIDIDNTFLGGNVATLGAGGGVLLEGSNQPSPLNGNTYSDNNATVGGGLAIYNASVVLSAETYDVNTATSDGGGIYGSGAQVNITSETWIGFNEADIDAGDNGGTGGGIHVRGVGGFLSMVAGTQVDGNQARAGGGGIYIDAGAGYSIAADITRNEILSGSGAGMWLRSGGLINSPLVDDNTGATSGGGILVDHTGTTNIVGTVVSNNEAGDGAGLYQTGGATVNAVRTAFIDNIATSVGGGIALVQGTLSTVSSTVARNTATSGAGVWVNQGSTADLYYTTITANVAITSAGGLQVPATVFSIDPVGLHASVIGENTAPDGPNCNSNGAAVLLHGFNVYSLDACTTVDAPLYTGSSGSNIATSNPDLLAGTQFYTPNPTSPALDIVNLTACDEIETALLNLPGGFGTVDQSQTPVSRPQGAGCDAGAVEVPSEVGPPALDVQLINAVPVGPTGQIVPANQIKQHQLKSDAGSVQPTGPDLIELMDAPLSQIPLSQIPLSQIPLSQIPLSQIAFDAPAINALFQRIHLSELTLLPDENGVQQSWEDVLAGSDLADVPLQNITLAMALADPTVGGTIAALPLSQIDLGSTPLSQIALFALPLSQIAVGDFPWAELLGETGEDIAVFCQWLADNGQSCADLGIDGPPYPPVEEQPSVFDATIAGAPLSQIPLSQILLQGAPLSQIPLAQIPLSQLPLSQIFLENTPLSQIPLGQIPLSQIDISGTPLSQIPLSQIPLSQIPLSQIPLGQIPLSQIPLSQIPLSQIPLSQIPLSQIPLAQIGVDGTPLSQIPLSQIPLSQIFVSGIPLSQIPLSQIPLSQIPLSQIAHVVDCQAAGGLCSAPGATLGDAADGGFLLPGAEIAHLVGALVDGNLDDLTLLDLLISIRDMTRQEIADTELGDLVGPHGWDGATLNQVIEHSAVTLAELEAIVEGNPTHLAEFAELMDNAELGMLLGFGNMTLGDVLHLMGEVLFDALIETIIVDGEGITLLDLLLTILPPSEFPWQEIDVSKGGIQLAGTINSYLINIDIDGQTLFQPVTVELTLPPTAVFTSPSHVPTSVNGNVITWELVIPNGQNQIQLIVGDSISLGLTEATVDVTYPEHGLSDSDTLSYVATEMFEPNDAPGDSNVLALQNGFVHLSHISTETDVDLWSVQLDRGEGLSTYLGGIEPGADFDLVVYGPPGTDVNGFWTPSADDDATSKQENDDVPLLTDRPALHISAQRGTRSERIDLPPVRATGTYLVQVSGYNGSFSDQPYTLRSQSFNSIPLPDCLARSFPFTAGVPSIAPTGLDADTRTLFLFARDRFARLHGTQALADVEAALAPVAGMDGSNGSVPVNGAVVDLGGESTVASAFAAFDSAAGRCQPETANDVVDAIRDVVLDLRTSHPTIDSVVLIGADDVVPFARVPDLSTTGNERTYAGYFFGENNELVSSLAFGYYLSDNPYGDSSPDNVGGRPLWVPEVAVGRLVETPAEIVTQLETFVQFNGRLDSATTRTSAVAGYDFLTDGSEVIADYLDVNQVTPTSRLINDDWTAQELRALLGAGGFDLTSPNAHYDHFASLSAFDDSVKNDPNKPEPDLFKTTDIASGYAGTLNFTMGCHSGLSVSDVSIGQGVTTDWAQTYAAQGGNFIGNTGTGYGDTVTIAYTEKLLSDMARRLTGTMSIGEALAFAKAEYTADLSMLGVHHEKVVMQATFYGLPMYRVGTAADAQPVVPQAEGVGIDPSTGQPVSAGIGYSSTDNPTVQKTSPSGTWWEVEETSGGPTFSPQVTPGQPIQPRWEQDVTAHDGNGGMQFEARGVVIESLSSSQTLATDPAVATPTFDESTATEVERQDMAFPTSFARVSNYATPDGPRSKLVFTPGQFRGDDDGGAQLLFDDASFSVYYADPAETDMTPAQVVRTQAIVDEIDGVTAGFRVETVEAESDVERVVVLYREPGASVFQAVDLQQVAGPDADGREAFEGQVTLTSTITPSEDLEYIVQAVNTASWVGVSSAKGIFHTAVVDADPPGDPDDPQTPGTPVVTAGGTASAGWYDGPVTIDVSGDSDGDATVLVNGTNASTPVTLTADGTYRVDVVDEGVTNTMWISIDTVGPDVTIVTPPDGAVYPRNAVVEVEAVATDEDGSGVDSVEHPQFLDTAVTGVHQVTATATDVAGNEAQDTNSYRVVDLVHVSSAAVGQTVTVDVLGAPSGTPVHFGNGVTVAATTPVTVNGEAGFRAQHAYSAQGTYQVTATVQGTVIDGGLVQVFGVLDTTDKVSGTGTLIGGLSGILFGAPSPVLPTVAINVKYTNGVPTGTMSLNDALAGFSFSSTQVNTIAVQNKVAQVRGVGTLSGVPGNVQWHVTIVDGGFLIFDKLRIRVWKGPEVFYDTHPGALLTTPTGAPVLLGGYNLTSSD